MTKTILFKFGGASVKDADSIKNLAEILFNRLRNRTVIVVSAMGKTTNALEEILDLKLSGKAYSLNSTKLKEDHLNICRDLFLPQNPVFPAIKNFFSQLEKALEKPVTRENYDEFYDKIVPFGELVSSRIVQEYLCFKDMYCIWQDAREIIRTTSDFRFGKVDWEITGLLCKKQLNAKLERFPVITQGFIGSDEKGRTTTLGREGSDYTAAIIGHCLGANSVTIWKDVAGVLNADPKRFPNTIKFDELDYREAAEMTYYGASVIHPKTIKPLANLSIPLFVKSFLKPDENGTKIHGMAERNRIPCIVVKDQQILVSFGVTDFSFINELHIHKVFSVLDRLKLKVNLLQTSAITITIVVDRQIYKLELLIAALEADFSIRYNENLQLITVINHNDVLNKELMEGKEILLEQLTRSTFQMVYRELSQ